MIKIAKDVMFGTIELVLKVLRTLTRNYKIYAYACACVYTIYCYVPAPEKNSDEFHRFFLRYCRKKLNSKVMKNSFKNEVILMTMRSL